MGRVCWLIIGVAGLSVLLFCGGCAVEQTVKSPEPVPSALVPVTQKQGVDVQDFQRVYLPSPEPVVLFADSLDDLSKWWSVASENVKQQLTMVDGETGPALQMQYEMPTNGGWKKSVGWCVTTRKLETPIVVDNFKMTFSVRASNPIHLLDVKFVDVDGGVYDRQIAMTTNWVEWQEIVTRPEDIRHNCGGTNDTMDAIKRIEFAVNGNVRGGTGQLFIDSVRIENNAEQYAEVMLSQVGFHATDKKQAVMRVVATNGFVDPVFSVIDAETGQVQFKGTFSDTDFTRWKGKYYVGDFSEISTPGSYYLSVLLNGVELKSEPFEIGDRVLTRKVTSAVLSFLRYMQCGNKCHPNDPIIGGYHDTFFDIGNRMWSLVHMIMGLSMVVESGEVGDLNQNRIDDAMDELLFALRFAFQVQLDNGGVGAAGVGHRVPPGTVVETWSFLPEEDTIPREIDQHPVLHTTCYYVGSLCRAYPLLKKTYPVIAEETLSHIQRAAAYLLSVDRPFYVSHEQGGFIYAMTELYKLTGDQSYLQKVPRHLRDLSKLQDLDASHKEIPVCGNFYHAAYDREFTYQYKFVEYNLAILLGLLNIVELFEPSSPEWLQANYMLEVFLDCYMKPMASLTPYGQMALGMEHDGDRYRVAFFSPWNHPWVGAHGLNCDYFAYGLLAMRMGYLFDDPECEVLADNQMQWVLGQNPLRYSMVCGVGWNNPQVWATMHNKGGPFDGGIPNGIVGDQCDFPKWVVVFSSGEYWLPHNDFYLILSAILDSPGSVSGQVTGITSGGADEQVTIYNGSIRICSIPLDDEGRFGPVELSPQQTYRVCYEKEGQRAEQSFVLLSDEKEVVHLDVAAAMAVRIACVMQDTTKAIFNISVQNKCNEEIKKKLSIRVFDGEKEITEERAVTIPVGETITFEKGYRFNNKQPLLLVVDDAQQIVCYRE